MNNFKKKKINKILSLYGWKLIKFRKIPEPNPYGKLDIEVLKAMNNSTGIIHLGAHRGTEAEVYNWFGKNVIWIEALSENFSKLEDNLYFYKNQIAFQALLSDKDGDIKKFYISNNDAACSSMFDFTQEIKKSNQWKNREHKMINSIDLKTITLDTLFKNNSIVSKNYNHWIIDLQGSEYLTLKGSENSLKDCKSLLIEVSKKEFYNGGVVWSDIKNYLEKKKFFPTREPEKDEDDILFLKRNI